MIEINNENIYEDRFYKILSLEDKAINDSEMEVMFKNKCNLKREELLEKGRFGTQFSDTDRAWADYLDI